jgi:fatty-acid desaturase
MEMKDETTNYKQGAYNSRKYLRCFIMCLLYIYNTTTTKPLIPNICFIYIYAMNYHRIGMGICLHDHQTHNVFSLKD